MNTKKEGYYKELISYGLSKFKANFWSSKMANLKPDEELGNGLLYKLFRESGISKIDSKKAELYHWAQFDKEHPNTPYEQGLINFIEGKSKLKYNQIILSCANQ